MKSVYLDDIAVQYHVVTGAGVPLRYAGLVHVNNQYVRQGGVDVQQLFTRQDLTENVVERQDEVRDRVATLRDMLAEEMPEAYKDVNEVVGVVAGAGISKRVCRMKPIGVIKG